MATAVFLDRDGTINVEKKYVYKPEEIEFENGSLEAIAKLNSAGYKVIVITNQAGIARGYYTEEDVDRLHQWINSELAKYGAHIDRFYYCPHHPEHGIGIYKKICFCRKPRIGLIKQAINEFNINVQKSFLVGDRETDIYAGLAAGLKSILVLTGYGAQTKKIMKDYKFYADNLDDAVGKYILN